MSSVPDESNVGLLASRATRDRLGWASLAVVELIGSMFFTVISGGVVLSAGALTYQFSFLEMTIGRLTVIALGNALVRVCVCVCARALAGLTTRCPRPAASIPTQAVTALLYAMLHATQNITPSKLRNPRGDPSRLPCGHFNPVATFALGMLADIPLRAIGLHVVAQFTGAILGAGFLATAVPHAHMSHGGATDVNEFATWHQALAAEALVGFVYVFFLLHFVYHGEQRRGSLFRHAAPLAMGLVVLAVSVVAIPVSGASGNPFRSFAPALFANVWSYHWVYWVGPVLGATLAVLMTRALNPAVDDE